VRQAKRALRDLLVGPLSMKQMAVLCRELKSVGEAGIPPVRGLLVIAEHTGSLRVRRLLRQMAEHIRCGASFSDAVEWHGGRFPGFFRATVRAAEASGKLETAFEYLSEYYEEHLKLRRAVVNAMTYPLAIVVFAGVFIPILTAFWSQMANLKHDSIQSIILGQARCLGIVVFEWWLVFRLRIPQGLWSLFGAHIPILAPIARGMAMSRFFQCLAMLLEGGIGLPRAVEYAAKVSGSVPLQLSLAPAPDRLRRGATLTDALSACGFFTPTMRAMLEVGEQSGKVDAVLRKLSQYAQSEAMHRARVLIAVLESGLILYIGVSRIL
jgi:type IV pilus assembly protein PilC